MDVCLAIKQRLEELGLEQRNLAAAAEVTESYISQAADSQETDIGQTESRRPSTIEGSVTKPLKGSYQLL